MKRIASSSAVAVAPTYSADAGTPGHFAESPDPTHLTAKWCEAQQEAIVRTIEDGGGTPSDSMSQFSDAVAGVHAIKSGATTTGTATTPRTRTVIASSSSTASASSSAVVASGTCTASGASSIVAASGYATASGDASAVIASGVAAASGTSSAVIASVATGPSVCEASGPYSLVAACNTAALASGSRAVVLGSQSSTASGDGSAVIGGVTNTATAAKAATLGCTTSDATGVNAVIVGSVTAVASGAASFVAASNTVAVSGAGAVILAGSEDSTDTTNAATQGALISVHSCHLSANATRSVVLASHNVNMDTSYSVGGGVDVTSHVNGTNNDGQTWRIESSDGDIFTDGTAGAGAADFAEMFENESAGELPPGSLVGRSGRKVRLALPGDRVHGVVSAAPAVLGGSPLSWPGRYERDEWGRKVPMDFDGITIPRPASDYDPTLGYIRRTERPAEWTPVALIGQVRVRIGSSVQADDFLAPGPDGCAVATASPLGRPVEVMEIVQEYDPAKGYGVALCLVG